MKTEQSNQFNSLQIPAEPILMQFDKAAFEQEVEHIYNVAGQLQSIVNCYNLLNLGELMPGEFKSLFEDAECLVYDKMTNGEEVSIAGLKVHKHKAMELLIKPEGYETLIEQISGIKLNGFDRTTDDFKANKFFAFSAYNHFELVNGNVEVKADELLAFEELFKVYAKTESAKKMFMFFTSIFSMIEEFGLEQKIRSNPNGFANIVKACTSGGYSDRFELSIKDIAKYNEASFNGQF